MHSLFEPLEMEARAGTQLAPVVLAVALDAKDLVVVLIFHGATCPSGDWLRSFAATPP